MFEKIRKAVDGFVQKVTHKSISEQNLDDALSDLQMALLENDVAYEATERINDRVKKTLEGEQIGLLQSKKDLIKTALYDAILAALTPENPVDLFALLEQRKKAGEPLTLMFLGVNGTGKTTTIAKITQMLQKKGYSVVLACADTFRAGSAEQIQIHADRLNVRVLSRPYGSDPASVAFDAINHARARGINVVLIDTAGRMQTDKNLMAELSKIHRVAEPDLVIFVGDALAGNDAIEQAKTFNEKIGIDAAVLTKVDADAKGGAALSIAIATGKPIIFIGVGQEYSDIEVFNPEWFAQKIVAAG
ncbi:MAG: signal recognition particle-docking protein FtsY [Candidatus Hermodarchaeota archaeon]|nr:signal recognition particle-docking protein FtsY [Candidatus Hermodarchaeota archaeon]